MSKCRFRAMNPLWLGWPVIALVAVAALSPAASAAEHVVLGEEVTAIW